MDLGTASLKFAAAHASEALAFSKRLGMVSRISTKEAALKPAPYISLLVLALALFAGCEEEPINRIVPPQLLVNSPLNFGNSPIGVPQRGRLVLGNAGQARLEISEIILDPDDSIFEVGAAEMPLLVTGSGGNELILVFTPTEAKEYRTTLTFVANQPDNPATTVVLMGEGESNIICHPCNEAPESQCHETEEGMLIYLPTTDTDCENENGFCAYEMIYVPCDNGPCDPETGLCPDTPVPTRDAGVPPEPQAPFDAGTQTIAQDAGQPVSVSVDAGQSVMIIDAGMPAWDAGQPPIAIDAGPISPGGATCLEAPHLLGPLGMLQAYYDDSNDYQTAWVTANWSSGCTNHSTSDGNEVVYAVDLPIGATLTITVNGECAQCDPDNNERIDEVIYLLNTCPLDGVSYDNSLNNCVAGAQENFGVYPDEISETMTYTNNTGFEETLYVIVDAWCNGGSNYCPSSIDPFTLEWQIQLPY